MDNAVTQFKPFEDFCRCLLDGWAVVNNEGRVVKCNQMLGQIIGLSSKKIMKEPSFDNLLELRIGNDRLDVKALLAHESATRLDEVIAKRLQDESSELLGLIIGIYPLKEPETNTSSGSFILMRDVTAERNLQGIYTETAIDAVTDTLTGLKSRRYFDNYFSQRQATDDPSDVTTLIMIDIDFFKKVNDVYGHQAGDMVLSTTGKLILSNFRRTDIGCRYGGEEFLVILPHTDLAGGVLAAENLRKKIQDTVFQMGDTVIPVTASFGVATIPPGETDHEATLEKADRCLYKAKESGRNRVFSCDFEGELRSIERLDEAS